jgi:hypothetical protein
MTSYQEADGAADGGLKGFRRYTSCLIPVIAAIVLLALGVTFINYVIDSEGSDSSTAAESDVADTTASPAAPEPVELPAHSGDRYSDDGIRALLTGLGWTQYGDLSHYELGGSIRQTRKFRKDGAKISVTIHSFKSQRRAREKAKTLGAAERRVQLDHKVVTLEPLNGSAESELPHLIDRFRAYRDMVRE